MPRGSPLPAVRDEAGPDADILDGRPAADAPAWAGGFAVRGVFASRGSASRRVGANRNGFPARPAVRRLRDRPAVLLVLPRGFRVRRSRPGMDAPAVRSRGASRRAARRRDRRKLGILDHERLRRLRLVGSRVAGVSHAGSAVRRLRRGWRGGWLAVHPLDARGPGPFRVGNLPHGGNAPRVLPVGQDGPGVGLANAAGRGF